MQKHLITVFIFLLFATNLIAQVNHLEIYGQQTDSQISLDLMPSGDTVFHQVFINSSVTSKNKLLVFLPGTGARPAEHYKEFCKTAANEGYHAIGLVYKNAFSISQLCGTTIDTFCSEKARMEIIYGTPLHSVIAVDSANSIMNRLTKLLHYLSTNYPSLGWNSFINSSNMELYWQDIALAGHSQGGGHAALIARDKVVDRVLFFNCPSDKNINITNPMKQPSWFFDTTATSDSSYYAFYHQQNGGPSRLAVYNLFGLGKYGNTVNVDMTSYPYHNSHILYTDSMTFNYSLYTNPSCNSIPYNPHSDIIVDCELPYDVLGNNPYEVVWQYMLNNNVSNIVNSNFSLPDNPVVKLFPNPSNGSLTILGKKNIDEILLYSSTGNLLQTFPPSESNIDLSKWPPALYFIKVRLGELIYFKKIVRI